MKKNPFMPVIALLLTATPISFGYAQTKVAKSVLDGTNVVATKTKVKNSEVVTCNVDQLKNTVNIPLSELIEGLQMVKLDNRDEALVDESFTTVTDNYILVRNKKQNPYKLFDKKGKFIASIGSYGQGPNEYLNVYDDFLDEKTKRIYILPWQSDKVLVFDFKGNALAPIVLPTRVPKGKIFVDPISSVLSVAQLPFAGEPMVAWSQGLKPDGKKITSIKANNLTIRPDFSNEVNSGKNTGAFDFFIFTFFELRPDSLYHFDYKNNKLLPKFTLNFKNKPIKIHDYNELPRHYLGNVTVEVKLSENLTTTEKPQDFIIDKKTMRGAFFKLYNNFEGNMPVDWPSFNNGYYVRNVDPGQLLTEVAKQLKNTKLSPAQRQKLTALSKSINENDNNYVFFGKLKK